MTDRRYQRDLNSLIRERFRRALGAALPKPAVLGGSGYASATVPLPVIDNRCWFPREGWTYASGEAIPVPASLATPYLYLRNTPSPYGLQVLAARDDIYLYNLPPNLSDQGDIYKNKTLLRTGASLGYAHWGISLAVNSDYLYTSGLTQVADPPNPELWAVNILARRSGQTLYTRSGTDGDSWLADQVPVAECANDVSVIYRGGIGAPPVPKLFVLSPDLLTLKQTIDEPIAGVNWINVASSRNNFVACQKSAGTFHFTTYDNAGAPINTQAGVSLPEWFDSGWFDVNTWGMWITSDFFGSPPHHKLSYVPRDTTNALDFDFAARVEVDYPPYSNPDYPFNRTYAPSCNKAFELEDKEYPAP